MNIGLSREDVAKVMALLEPLTSSKTDDQTHAAMAAIEKESPGFCGLIMGIPTSHQWLWRLARFYE